MERRCRSDDAKKTLFYGTQRVRPIEPYYHSIKLSRPQIAGAHRLCNRRRMLILYPRRSHTARGRGKSKTLFTRCWHRYLRTQNKGPKNGFDNINIVCYTYESC